MRGRDIGGRARVVVQARLWLSAVLALAAPLALAQHQAYNLPPQVPAAQLEPLEQQRRQLFERLLTEPGDTDASFAYAVLSTQLGDYEAAIATYERLLIQHPNTARIQLELAAVYFRLGALVQARQLFEQVLQRPDTPDNVRLRVNGYLAAIAEQRRQQGGFSGRLSVGLRTESNANAAPDIGSIELNGLPFELAPEARAASDQSTQLGLSLRHRQPFAGNAHLLDVAFQAASNNYRELDQISNQIAELRVGPDFSLQAAGLRQGRLWTSAVAAQSWLDGSRYQRSHGVSSGLRWAVARQSTLQLGLDWRQEDYTPAPELASARDYSGQRWRSSALFSQQAADNWQWLGGLHWEQRNARTGWETYREPRLQLGISHRHRSPLGPGKQPWTSALSVQQAWRRHQAPMPAINALRSQHSQEQLLQWVSTVPLNPATQLQLYAGWRRVDSNYDLRDYINRYAGVTLAYQF
ncbi:MAG: tetratricopeptide repeat protein [Stenotrophomonas koreensis]